MATINPVCRLQQCCQSVWLDYIERRFVTGGGLAGAIEEDCVSGVTSNPAIFYKAMAHRGPYDAQIESLSRAGLKAGEIYEALVVEDIRSAADVLADVYRKTDGLDGYVSLEVSPHLARDSEGTYREGKRLWATVDRPNLMIKVPGTIEGIAAIRRLTADGVNVNVTLLFSVERYAEAANAFMEGLEQRVAERRPIDRIASVASFFLSRIDTLIDKRLDMLGASKAKALKGEAAVACARLAYRRFEALIDEDRWSALEAKGAKPQRLLWASTGTKDPAYSDTKYIEPLIGPDTVTTMPPETLAAYRDDGDPACRLNDDPEYAQEIIAQLHERKIDMNAIAAELELEGLKKFVEPFDATHALLAKRIGHLS